MRFNEQFPVTIKMTPSDILKMFMEDQEMAIEIIKEYLCRDDDAQAKIKEFVNEE